MNTFVLYCIYIPICLFYSCNSKQAKSDKTKNPSESSSHIDKSSIWNAPDTTLIPQNDSGRLISYGRDLIRYTSKYLGPNGSVMQISNGMNCQNCHLNAGTKPFGNNYSAVASTFPKFRARSGTIESIEKRINDCLERSLNGKSLDSSSTEMRAIVAYMKWLGQGVEKGKTPLGAGLIDVPFLNRPADSAKGQLVYISKCAKCHGNNGEGWRSTDKKGYLYPPLWGSNSYNIGAGLYRLSRFAGFVKANMPYDTNSNNPNLTDEEAWDIAAFVNSKQRPIKSYPHDWPDSSLKPFDHPFGPYHDNFTERQHKYGPFQPIQDENKTKNSSGTRK
ncbi:c-type cytochrome [Solitalea lacus]|uniref:c-type cytochrome n=1 Tax=Solitalea lacus TaxID=2911172 RepID=UPI001EDC4B7A|nr:c-type cytochrome [Solitalea lacus]UKJ08885.1 c-type cytochrome [Solitalea lacus]